ncbi:GNAT family N-acetyltransferase [Nocardioides sp. BP30]|uniref:GNAT family N-acetyltransferase n=1 Tax=Nocardioides sp. BP30 TaxID=3036374 RepID=UPI002468FE9F|nr:GNAT family N-acetyltransferase [Nocardioides sp. BP30]WGL53459.1 GNAT family N-acetyltransferase [Nocardioides sp. BP30]
MTLRPDAGEAAETGPIDIALADIVSGKPVPPRPSHLTRVSARDAELRGLGVVPGLETAELGGWLLRTDPAPVGRLLKRANSCLAMGSPGLPFPEATERLLAFYAARDREPMAQVEQGSEVEAAFLAAGWRPLGRGDASFQATALARLHRLLAPGGGACAELVEAPHGHARGARAEIRDDHGTRIAAGSAVLDRDWLGLHGLSVDADHRRRGLATALVADLVEWGAEQGARTVWLHVETDNVTARAMYEKLGFREHHAVRYLVPA